MRPVEIMARAHAQMLMELRGLPLSSDDIAYGKWLMESSSRDLDAMLAASRKVSSKAQEWSDIPQAAKESDACLLRYLGGTDDGTD